MTEPRLHHVICPDATHGHRMAYWQWGQSDSVQVVVCVHGLTRQGRDFDVLAQALCAQASSKGIRVICPDMAGRGESDWLKDPAGYQIPFYAADMLALLAQLHADAPIGTLDWVGTSMGGLIGMVICGQPELPLPVPVRRLVLNDVGPALQWSAQAGIKRRRQSLALALRPGDCPAFQAGHPRRHAAERGHAVAVVRPHYGSNLAATRCAV